MGVSEHGDLLDGVKLKPKENQPPEQVPMCEKHPTGFFTKPTEGWTFLLEEQPGWL